MVTLVVNGTNYDMDKLSEEAKAQVVSLQFVDAELVRLNAQIAVYQTARNGYINALKPHLEALGEETVKVQ